MIESDEDEGEICCQALKGCENRKQEMLCTELKAGLESERQSRSDFEVWR